MSDLPCGEGQQEPTTERRARPLPRKEAEALSAYIRDDYISDDHIRKEAEALLAEVEAAELPNPGLQASSRELPGQSVWLVATC